MSARSGTGKDTTSRESPPLSRFWVQPHVPANSGRITGIRSWIGDQTSDGFPVTMVHVRADARSPDLPKRPQPARQAGFNSWRRSSAGVSHDPSAPTRRSHHGRCISPSEELTERLLHRCRLYPCIDQTSAIVPILCPERHNPTRRSQGGDRPRLRRRHRPLRRGDCSRLENLVGLDNIDEKFAP